MSRQHAQAPRQRYHTLASPALPNVPQRAVIRARESPRARFDSQLASRPRTTSSHPRRKRAITLGGDGLTPPQLPAADSSNPVLLEMRKGVLLDVGNVLNQFSKMDRTIRAFCEQSSDYIGKSKRLPRMTHQPTLPKNSPVGRPAHDFSSTEEYLYFILLSIINTHLYEDIFRPFHPAASPQESDRYEEEYLMMIDKSLQRDSAAWRSQKFSSIDNRVGSSGVASLIQRVANAIVGELAEALKQLPEPTSIPDSFMPGLESILNTAYEWNRTIKKDILKYDFEPYVVEALADWDPMSMESFERLRATIKPNTKVICSVSLGLVGSVSLGGSRVSHVQRKARVLVEEWFFNTPRGRTKSTPGAAPSNPQPALPVPRQRAPSRAAPHVTTQPGPMRTMSVTAQAQQPSAPPEKKGFLCC